jgi:hypothetical protein
MIFLVIFFAPFRCQALGCSDVFRLCALVSAAQQNDDGVAPLLEVNAEAWSIIDAQFADAFSYWHDISGISIGQAIQARSNQAANPLVLKPYALLPEGSRLQKFHRCDFRSL